jgi:hypothetical protein
VAEPKEEQQEQPKEDGGSMETAIVDANEQGTEDKVAPESAENEAGLIESTETEPITESEVPLPTDVGIVRLLNVLD